MRHQDLGAILRRRVENEIASDDAASAGHLLDDDGGIARNETAKMRSDSPSIKIVGAARAGAHDDADDLALVEIRCRLCCCEWHSQGKHERRKKRRLQCS